MNYLKLVEEVEQACPEFSKKTVIAEVRLSSFTSINIINRSTASTFIYKNMEEKMIQKVVNITSNYFNKQINSNEYRDELFDDVTKKSIAGLLAGSFVALSIGAAFLPFAALAIAGIGIFRGYNLEENTATAIANQLNEQRKSIILIINEMLKANTPSIITEENIINQNKSNLPFSKEQQLTKDFLFERSISKLYHFTPAINLDGILQYGLLSRKQLNARNNTYEPTDMMRYDGKEDCISLSIEHVNQYYKSTITSNKKLVDLIIDSKILYELGNMRYYCITNAANQSIPKQTKFSGLVAMFNDPITYGLSTGHSRTIYRHGKASRYTTDDQAEILFAGPIPLHYIVEIMVYDLDTYDKYANNTKVKITYRGN